MVAAFDETGSKQRALAQNEQMQRAMAAEAAKGVLLANVSHELRTPLNAILGFSDIMRQEPKTLQPPHYAQYIEHIHEAALYLLSLVDDLLDGSSTSPSEPVDSEAPCDIAKEVESVVTSLRSVSAKAGVQLECTVPHSPLPTKISARHARQIISNLLTNGIKFTPAGGSVSVELGQTDQRETILVVTDTGIGMTKREMDDSARRFTQARSGARGEKGYGLGLAIVNSILPLYGLKLEFGPGEKSGTSAIVTFPPELREPDEPTKDSA